MFILILVNTFFSYNFIVPGFNLLFNLIRLSSSEPSDEIVLPAACLVALACASNSTRTVLHTLYILNQLKTVQHLPVNDIIYILSKLFILS